MDDAQQAAEADQLARRASSFGTAAARYAAHRPDYPADGIRWILALAPERDDRPEPLTVLDLGAGTGKLTRQLAGLTGGSGRVGGPMNVVAVEPDEQMLAELRRQLPGVTAMQGSAEAIPLPDGSVDAVISGQAMHWFNLDLALPEIARVLRPGGVMGGLWNADDASVGWVTGLHEATGRRTVIPIGGTERDDDDTNEWLTEEGQQLFTTPERSDFGHSHLRTADSMIETLRTHSLFLIMDPAERKAVLAGVRDYLAATPQTADGEFRMPLRTMAIRSVRR